MGVSTDGFGLPDEAAIYIEEVRGYRYWQMTPNGTLRSLVHPKYWWPATSTETAKCKYSDDFVRREGMTLRLVRDDLWYLNPFFEKMTKHGSIPEPNCFCGFWAWYTPEDALNPDLKLLGGHHLTDLCLGVVMGSGKIIPGTIGFRAEKMRIEALIPCHNWNSKIDWGNKVVINKEELVSRFPPQNIPWREEQTT